MPKLRSGRPLLALVLLACQSPASQAGVGPVPLAERRSTASAAPSFSFAVFPLSAERKERMLAAGVWRPGCPVSLDGLVLLELAHWNFEGEQVKGELVVAREVAKGLVEVFRELYRLRFPIQQMQGVESYAGSDDASMSANNTSAFNCRPKTGGRAFSRHAYGKAVDLNPVQNPFVKGDRVLPPQGAAHLERTAEAPGRIVQGPVTNAFAAQGWTWGGRWSRVKDYQHFETQ